MVAENIISKMNTYYEDRAPWHDQFMNFQNTSQMISKLTEIIDIVSPIVAFKSVFEIGCGTGNWSAILSQFSNSVIATDFSDCSLELAKEKYSKIDNLIFIKSDAYLLDNIHESFDVIFMADFYSHIPNNKVDSVIRNLKKISKKETIVISIDMTEKDKFKNEKFYFDSDNNRISERNLPNGNIYEIIKNFPNESELQQRILKHGTNFKYYEFSKLERWLMQFQVSNS